MASRTTGIEWTETTWNPVRGCSKVSPGCRNCYAEVVGARFSGPGRPYSGLVRNGRWTGRVDFVPTALGDPLGWKAPRRVFVNSMSDLFHEAVTDEQIAAVFGIMAAAPQHTFQVLTKRADRMSEWFRWLDAQDDDPYSVCLSRTAQSLPGDYAERWESRIIGMGLGETLDECEPWPLPNVWLGVSAEDQQRADERIPHLLDCPAAVRWVSYEPALGPIDWRAFFALGSRAHPGGVDRHGQPIDDLPDMPDWIVVGGESGGGARRFNVQWARATVEACREAGVAVFVKQLGANPWVGSYGVDGGWRLHLTHPKGGDPTEWPGDLNVREYPRGT